MIARLLVICLAGLLSQTGLSAEPGDQPLTPIPEQKSAKLAGALEEMLGAIDRSQFDLFALLDVLDYDEMQAIDFVSREIAYEPYEGVLRGAEGTLISRSGNSLDQAVLLARLLKDMGLDARIVSGAAPDAEALRPALSGYAASPPVFRDPTALKRAAALLSDGPPDSPPAGEPGSQVLEIPEAVRGWSDDLFEATKRSQASISPALIESPYYWVEYRDASAGDWQPVHPALGDPHAKPALAATGYITDSIDPELQHRIRVEAFIERSRSGTLEKAIVAGPHEFPAANLTGVTFGYSVIPDAFLSAEGPIVEGADEALAGSNLFFPVFDFGSGRLDKVFDSIGNVLSADDASSAMAGVFGEVSKGFLAAAEELSGNASEGKAPVAYVTRHWLEITLLRPGQPPKVIVRDIARWQGDADEFRKSLARTAYFRVATGRVSPAQILERTLGAQRALLTALSSATPLKLEESALAQFSLDAESFLLMSDLAAAGNTDTLSFRDEPAILARYLPYGRIDATRDGFDIVHTPRRAVALDSAEVDMRTTVFNGVVDSWLEQELFSPEDFSRSAYGLLSQRLTAGGELAVVGDGSKISPASLPVPARETVLRDLSNGDRVLVVGAADQCNAWWRVDPLTGDTLSMLANGWGGVIPEYLKDLAAIHGKLKIGSLAAGCGLTVPFITASAAINGLGLLELNDALGNSNLDICAQIPQPNLQALCSLTVSAMGMAAATGAGQSGLSTSVLTRICVMSAL